MVQLNFLTSMLQLLSHTGGILDALNLRHKIDAPYFDYQKLKAALGDYSHERRAISDLIKKGAITRVKKGLYVWGDKLNVPYSKEILANLIYGPSYISLEYALSYYGLIPERVEIITSVTTKRKKEFNTPVGVFVYEYLSSQAFPWGQKLVKIQDNFTTLMASPEKAILDFISLKLKEEILPTEFEELLFSDLRIDQDGFRELRSDQFTELAHFYRSVNVKNFSQYISKKRS